MEKAASKDATKAPRSTPKPAPLGPVPRRRPPQVKARPRSSSPPPSSSDRPKSPKRNSAEAVSGRALRGSDAGPPSKSERPSIPDQTGDVPQVKSANVVPKSGEKRAPPSTKETLSASIRTRKAVPRVDTLEALHAENSRLKQEVERQRAEIQELKAQGFIQQSAAAAEPIATQIVAVPSGSRSATPVRASRPCSVPPSRPCAGMCGYPHLIQSGASAAPTVIRFTTGQPAGNTFGSLTPRRPEQFPAYAAPAVGAAGCPVRIAWPCQVQSPIFLPAQTGRFVTQLAPGSQQ